MFQLLRIPDHVGDAWLKPGFSCSYIDLRNGTNIVSTNTSNESNDSTYKKLGSKPTALQRNLCG